MTRRRLAAAVALVAVVCAGLLTRVVRVEEMAADIAGDALYAGAAYAGLVLLFPRTPRLRIAAVAGLWCVAVELLQLTGIPLALGGRVPPLALLLGSGFDPRDLAVYVGAVAAAVVVDTVVSRLLPGENVPRGVEGSE